MQDPHIDAMHYVVSSGEGILYSNPEPVSFSNHLGTLELSDGKLRIAPTEHFPDEDSACQAVEPFLRAWEIESDLMSHIGMIRFKFDRAEVINRNPPPPDSPQVIKVKSALMVLVGESVSLPLTCSKYPQPPKTFHATLEVQHAYRRWLGYRLGKEPLFRGLAPDNPLAVVARRVQMVADPGTSVPCIFTRNYRRVEDNVGCSFSGRLVDAF